jgi:hypothetical protein
VLIVVSSKIKKCTGNCVEVIAYKRKPHMVKKPFKVSEHTVVKYKRYYPGESPNKFRTKKR